MMKQLIFLTLLMTALYRPSAHAGCTSPPEIFRPDYSFEDSIKDCTEFTPEELELISKVTMITTTSPILTNPSTEMLEEAQQGLMKTPAFRKCRKIIVFDGVPDVLSYRAFAYECFIENVKELVKTHPDFENTTLVVNTEHLNLGWSVGEAIKVTETPYVFVHQHDFFMLYPFDFFNLIRSMDRNPLLKHIKFPAWKNTPTSHFPNDDYIEGGALIPLTRTFNWFDGEHFSRVDYYKEFVMPRITRPGPMETFLNTWQDIRENHSDYGTYLYGDLEQDNFLYHLDGKLYQYRKFKPRK